MLSLNITKTDAITPASTAASREPNKYQATRVTSPPVAAEPIMQSVRDLNKLDDA